MDFDINRHGRMFHGTYLERAPTIIRYGLVAPYHNRGINGSGRFPVDFYRSIDGCPCGQEISEDEVRGMDLAGATCVSVIGHMEYPTETRRTGFGDGSKPVFFPNPQFGVFIGIEEFVDSLAVDRETDMAAFTGDEDALRSISIHDYYRHILADVRSCLEGTYEDSRIEIKVFSCLPWSSFDALFVPDDPCVPDYPLSEKRDGLDHDNAREIIIETLVREMEEMKPKEERIPIVDERGLFLYSP